VADAIGLSVGAAKLAAVVVDRAAVTRTAVLTMYPHRPPEVGLPGENPNLAERGLVITDFVDRVGDPVEIVASDGSSHRAEVLLADALRAMLYAVTRGQQPAGPVGVTHPAHWRPSAVDALRRGLAAVPEFATGKPAVVSDAVAALTALQHDPGVPARGVIALCDFGATGTSVTLADAANGFAPLAPTVRYADLSGDLIDQALLTGVIADLTKAGSADLSGTSAIGSLTRLRGQCRAAKERLSTAAVTSLTAELPGHRGEVRITRTELDEAVRGPLAGFMDELQDTLQRNGIRPTDLVAVASVGGGARIPIVTTTLSEHLRVPVVTSAQPELAAAIGSGLKAARGTVEESATSLAALPAAAAAAAGVAAAGAAATPDPAGQPTAASSVGALAWSDAHDIPDVAPAADYGDEVAEGAGQFGDGPRPRIDFVEPTSDHVPVAPVPWYRHPFAILAAGAVVVLAAIVAAVVLVANRADEPTRSTITTPSTTSTATPPPAATEAPPPATTPAPPPQTQTVTRQPPPRATITQQAPPPAPSEAPPAETPPPPTEPPPPEPPPSTEPPPWSPTAPYPTIPGLPWVPAPQIPAQPAP
jgi:hypothetical protein